MKHSTSGTRLIPCVFMVTLAWLIFWMPLVAAIIIGLFLLKRPAAAGWFGTGTLAAGFVLTLSLLMQYRAYSAAGSAGHVIESAITWIPLFNMAVEFGVLINGLTLLMLLIVTGIGGLIFLYSTLYMAADESKARYFACLCLFAFSMLGIVFSNNLIQIFIFWELVGLSSYLLIGFWYEKPAASTAGKKAFLTTRVGDIGMMIGILLLTGYLAKSGSGTFNFLKLEGIYAAMPSGTAELLPPPVLTAVALLIFMGVMGKSAQVPLHVWLPDAMEGPTPVSALIHAATMVAAGVFLLVRIHFLFEASADALAVIAWTGAVTALLAGFIAIVQDDIKKILAYSTLSQLGYMVLAFGLSHADAGMFHLTTHAFFKALLFLGAGSLIHGMHTQDIWKMSGNSLLKKMPVTSWTFLIGTLALMGVPPLSGYFSKEAVLAAAHAGPAPIFFTAAAVVFLTAFYMGRLCAAVFFSKAGSGGAHTDSSNPHHTVHESGWPMTLPLLVLAVLAVMGGYLPIRELIRGSAHPAEHHGESAAFLTALSLGLASAGFIMALILFRAPRKKSFPFPGILEKKFYFDTVYDLMIRYVQENIARVSDWFERRIVVEAGANGTANFVRSAGDHLRRLQTGMVQTYAFVLTAGVTLILYFFLIRG